MNKKMRQRIERILALADTTLEDLAVASHQKGFTRLMVHLDDGGFIDKAEGVYDCIYEINAPVGWRTIFECGTGSLECSCKECITGCPPDTWGAEWETAPVQKEIAKNLRTLITEK